MNANNPRSRGLCRRRSSAIPPFENREVWGSLVLGDSIRKIRRGGPAPPVAGSTNNQITGRSAGQNAKVTEDTSVEGIFGTCALQHVFEVCPEHPIDLHHLCDRWLPAAANKSIAEFAKHATNCAIVNVNVGSINVAQGLVNSASDRFANDPRVVRVAFLWSGRVRMAY